MKRKSKFMATVLTLAALISLVVPFVTLFVGNGTYAWQVKQPESIRMLLEIGLLFLLLGAVFFFISDLKQKLSAAAGLCLIFCWLHVVFLPMVISGLYVGYLILLGRYVQKQVINSSLPYGFLADFMVGSGVVITEFCLLSLLGGGSIPILRKVSLLQGALLYGGVFYRTWKTSHGLDDFFMESRRFFGEKRTSVSYYMPAALITFLIVMVLIQVGRMNITLDFDTLWYGVRSEYILDSGHGIYENPGLVGMSYVYSKGLEVLVLPLSDLASHSYLLFFNVWMVVLGLCAVYGIARFYMEKNYALLAAALVSAVPGVMNMSISAKPDIITWLLQLIMILYLLFYVKKTTEKENTAKKPVTFLILAAGAYALSLTMKPTSLVFSTAVFGMAGLYLLVTKRLSLKAPIRHWLLLLPPGMALIGIWARTMLITGMPVTSVFTSILAKLGFEMRYPFATGALPQNWQEESNLHVLLRRLYQMLLAPEGKDMSHVVIAWGTSLLFFLTVCLAVFMVCRGCGKQKREPMVSFVHVIFWPFLAVNLLSLIMLYQVDGNYFILLYTAVILAACRGFFCISDGGLKKLCLALLVPIMAFNVLMSAVSNWAWGMGFSDIKLLNSGRMNHEAMQHEDMIKKGNEEIWNILAENRGNRVIAFGNHPFCLEFPCIVQSYKDITSPWGNVDLVSTPEAFEEYMEYSKTDYIYAEAGYIGENSWSFSYGLLMALIERGTLTDLRFENGNMLAGVNLGQRSGAPANNPEENLQLFMENYKTAE